MDRKFWWPAFQTTSTTYCSSSKLRFYCNEERPSRTRGKVVLLKKSSKNKYLWGDRRHISSKFCFWEILNWEKYLAARRVFYASFTSLYKVIRLKELPDLKKKNTERALCLQDKCHSYFKSPLVYKYELKSDWRKTEIPFFLHFHLHYIHPLFLLLDIYFTSVL